MFWLIACYFMLFNPAYSQIPEFFEGIQANSPIWEIIRFQPQNKSFISIPELIYNKTEFEYLHVSGNSLPSQCTNLFLDSSKMYHVIKPKIPSSNMVNLADIKLPFSSIKSSFNYFLNKNFCIAFNKKNYAIGFDALASIPCMIDNCFVHLSGISLSTENGLIVDNLNPVTVYDSMRYHTVSPSPQFNMKFRLGMPLSASNLIYYPLGNNEGFHFRMIMDLTLAAKIDSLYFLNLRTQRVRSDLFFKGFNLFTFDNLISMNGILQDSLTDAMNTCHPSGVFSIIDLDGKPTKIFGSKFLAGFIGPNLFEAKAKVEVAFFMNMRTFQNNGLFLRTSVRLNLLSIIKVSVDLEIQKVNLVEMQRRVKSLREDSYCPDVSLSIGTKYLLDKFTKSQNKNNFLTNPELENWNRFFSVPNGYFFFFI